MVAFMTGLVVITIVIAAVIVTVAYMEYSKEDVSRRNTNMILEKLDDIEAKINDGGTA